MCHTEDFVHARSDSVDRGGTANFVIEFWSKFFAAFDDGFTFLVIWIPGIFSFGASFLAKSRESDLAEAVFDNFIAFLELIGFPIAEFFCGGLDGFSNLFDLFVGERVIVD